MRSLWAVHFAAIIGVAMVVMLDLRFESILNSGLSVQRIVKDAGWWRAGVWFGLAALAVGSLGMLCVRMFLRKQGAASGAIIHLLGITAAVALWCSLALNHSALAWQGKRMRISMRVDQLEDIAAPLRDQWPQRDSELPGIGPFMAYPFGKPSTLILLQSPPVSSPLFASDSLCVSAVERSGAGAIKLQLGGSPLEDWAEWHPRGSRPRSFTGGLSDRHSLHSSAPLGHGWFLVRYNVDRTATRVDGIAKPSPDRSSRSAVAI
ncbi:hypothetical protein [Rubripirellula lacrimiformis]|nr:hypothetical protein [Rubripirellula lacrimiformis]